MSDYDDRAVTICYDPRPELDGPRAAEVAGWAVVQGGGVLDRFATLAEAREAFPRAEVTP